MTDADHADAWCDKHQWHHDDMRVCLDDPECCRQAGCPQDPDAEIQEVMKRAADKLAEDMLDLLSEAVAAPVQFEPDDMAAFRVIDRIDWRIWSCYLIGQQPLPMCIVTGI